MPAIALTDYNGMYGVVEFFQWCKKAGIKALIGVELWLVHDISKKEKNESSGNIVLLAKNYDGYKELLKITSKANLDGYWGKARVDFDILEKHNKNIIAFMWWHTSYLGKMILANEETTKINETIARFHTIFDNNFYLELIAQDEKILPQLAKINKTVIELAPQTQTKLICNSNYHYIEIDDKEAAEVALAIKDGKRIYDEERRKIQGDYHISNEDEVYDTMTNNGYEKDIISSALTNNEKIADMINIEIPLGTILFPKYEAGEDIQKKYEAVKGKLIEEK